jgi:hypothetical protein
MYAHTPDVGVSCAVDTSQVPRTLSGCGAMAAPQAGGGLQRRASAPARGAYGVGDEGGAAARGLPMHFLAHSGKKKASKKERVLCVSTFTAAAALLGALWLLWMLLRANRAQGRTLVSHYNGWKARRAAHRAAMRRRPRVVATRPHARRGPGDVADARRKRRRRTTSY